MNQAEKKSIVTLLFLLLGALIVLSQTANPFDIKPSNVKRDTLKTVNKPITPPIQVTTTTPATTTPPKDTVKTSPKINLVTTPKSSQNPFDVRQTGAQRTLSPPPAVVPAPSAPGKSSGSDTVQEKRNIAQTANSLQSSKASTQDVQTLSEQSNLPTTPDVKKKKEVETKFQNILSNYVFWILFLSLILITFIVNLNRSLLPELFQSLTSDNQFRVIFREFSKGFSNILYYLMYLIFLIQAALFFYQVQTHFRPAGPEIPYLWFLLAILTIYLTRHFILFLLEILFPVEKEVSQYSFILMQFNICLGIIFFCINWFLAFTPVEMAKIAGILGLGLFVILYFVRQFRGLLVSARILVLHKFHFFLYLCVVDLLPVVIAGKYLINQSLQ